MQDKITQPGLFFVIEGGDGAGKTTVINRLRETFPDFVFTREPGGTPVGEQLRSLIFTPEFAPSTPETKLLAFFAARAENVARIMAARRSGKHVVSDRFDSASYAFQVAPFIGKPQGEFLESLFASLREKIVERELALPTAYVYLDLPSDEARRRKNSDALEQNHFDQASSEEYETRRIGFERFAERYVRPGGSWHTIDAALPREDVYRQTVEIIRKYLS